MSLEGTVSVVGSKVMPLEYGGMDSESSPSLSSSERTVEERREREIVEEVEEEIPSNIMEVEGDVDRCYDPDLGIVSEVREYESELGSRGSLRGLVGNYNLPHHVLIRLARVNERACLAPRDHWMPMYVHYLATGLRFPIPKLLVGLLLEYSIGITQFTPNTSGGKSEKGWYYFGPRSSNKKNRNLFTVGPSSIKGWKEKFFFVDDTEWSRREAEVEYLSAWKVKKVKHNDYKLNEDEVEEVGKLVREEGDLVDILYLTSSKAIEAAELYGPSSLSEVEMEGFLNTAEGLAILKKPRKKSKTSSMANKGATEREHLSSTSARALEVQQWPEPIRRSNEEVSKEVEPLWRKKRKVVEPKVRGDEMVEFVPRPSPIEVEPEVREREEAEVRGLGKGKELIPPPLFQKSLFEAKNITGAKRFLTATLLEVDRRQARDEAVSQVGALVVRHTLESVSWVNALAQEYVESVRDRTNLQKQCEELQKEKEELQRKNKEMQRKLDEIVPAICEDKIEAQDKHIENMNKGVMELKKNVNLLVHNEIEEHIGNFLNSSTFESIVNLYRLPTAILAFTNCRNKVKAQYPEVDVTTVTFSDQEEKVEKDGESLSADFRPLIKLRWERDAEGRTIFPPAFDAELVAVEEKADPPEVHPISSDKVQLAPHEAEVPPLPTGDEPPQPPPSAKEQPPFAKEQPPSLAK
ncbi:hypothetical protein SLEP1_g44413 [Rubroshorea leprosula]|uniref:Transposase (Putative), gypsy type n=1 Tax=Rubroshorea leprosula TaxID=152421 RepID=A0AAV5LH79_9ROSI|nr:hypothetical protein SLEP1_g44413 [Rubroshorea leprosula]